MSGAHVFRVRFHVGGGHVHCQLYVRTGEHGTFANSGNFVVRRGAEFKALMNALGGVEFVGIADGVGIEAASSEPGEPVEREICRDRGGPVGHLGECLACDAEAGVACWRK